MKPPPSSENDEQDQEIIKLLQELGSFESNYPPELLTARRAAFDAQIERLGTMDIEEGLDPGDEVIIRLLGTLKSAKAEYPPDLLAARHSAFLQQMGKAGTISVLDKLRFTVKSLFQYKPRIPAVPLAKLKRTSLVVAGLMIAAFIGSLLFSRAEQAFNPSSSQGVARPTRVLPSRTNEVSIIICKPDDQAPLCSPRELDSSQDLADQGNGAARPAVSKDARSADGTIYQAASVNDGRSDTSWISNSSHSWIKIDLGKATTINTISFQKGGAGSFHDNNPGQFVIAAALSDVYADGNSNNDYTEYAQVFNSEQTGFSGTISNVETISAQFPPVQARFIKITFERAGAAIEEVGVFMVQPPEVAEQPTRSPQDDISGVTLTPRFTNTLLPMGTATPLPTDTGLPTDTPIPTLTDTLLPSDTPIPLPTNTLRPIDTATPVPTDPLPLDIPTPPIVQPLPVSTEPIIVTGSDQNLTFTCNGNAVEVRGHANTVILLGSCSSITVAGNGNQVFWQSGSPVITNRGNENIISQI